MTQSCLPFFLSSVNGLLIAPSINCLFTRSQKKVSRKKTVLLFRHSTPCSIQRVRKHYQSRTTVTSPPPSQSYQNSKVPT
ncbi:hypothetical protein BZA77DRAFT_324753 [Pyronema omphalodes]|nr:hypothetical protein BZA77DRAFT_324753 [Pyronema omphalodes]